MKFLPSMQPKFFLMLLYILLGFSNICCYANENRQNFSAKIAVVDVEDLFKYSEAVIEMRKKINEKASIITQQMQENEQMLKKEETELIESKDKLSQVEFSKRLSDFNKKVSNAQEELRRQKIKIEKAHNKGIQAVHEASLKIINELAKKYQINMVLPSSQLLYSDKTSNLTSELIEELNKTLKVIEID